MQIIATGNQAIFGADEILAKDRAYVYRPARSAGKAIGGFAKSARQSRHGRRLMMVIGPKANASIRRRWRL